eukprot:g28816.t1
MYARAVRRCVNARFISRAHKIVQNITQAQHNAIHALKTNCNIVIKSADKDGTFRIEQTNAILQLIRFILDPNAFIFDNHFFIQTHRTAMGTKSAPRYANIFMHRRQTQDTTDRVLFVIQYFRVERLCHVLRSLQHVIDDDKHLAKVIPTPSLLTFEQPSNLKQTIIHSKLLSLQDNIDHNTTQHCHGNFCKTCQIIDMGTTIT